MSEKKGWGRTVMGWFVQEDEAPAPAAKQESVDDLIAKYASGPAPGGTAPPVEFKGEVPRAQGGSVDLPRIFESAGIDAEEQARISRAKELLKSLPAETPAATKKQIVEASLKAFGVPIEQIIEAGVQEIEALEAWVQREAQETQRTLADATAKIDDLTRQIAELKQLMEVSVQEQNAAGAAVNTAKLEIQQVLEFFGQDKVAAVVKASPKLHEPAPATPSK
jgi:hypothetical protein